MTQAEILALAIVSALFLLGLYLFFRSILHTLPETVWIAGTPTSPIRSLALGLVEITGSVVLQESVVSPATGLACCLTRYRQQRLEVIRTRNGTTTAWRTIDSGFLQVPFYLRDQEKNRVLVDPREAELYLPWETYYPDTGIRPGAIGSIRYLEQAVYSSSLLYVLGEAKKQSRFADVRGEVDADLAVLRGDPEKLAAYDQNKDGQVDAVEWEKAVRETEEKVTGEMVAAAADPNETLVVARPSVRRPFIISTRSEKDVLNRLRWKGYSTLVVGLALVFFNLAGMLGGLLGQPAFGKNYYQMVKSFVESAERN